MSKKFLFISEVAMLNDVAWQVYREKNLVKYHITSKRYQASGNGFAPKVDNWQEHLAWADVIVLEQPHIKGVQENVLRRYAKKIIGYSPYTDRLEYDRAFGQLELKSAGVPIIDYQEFTNFQAAINYIKDQPDCYVLKISGEAGGEKSLLYVGNLKTGADVVEKLKSYQKLYSGFIKSFILQKKVAGVEVAVGAFFNGRKFIQPINVNFEYKRLFPGNLGPMTTDMGAAMFWSKPNNLFNSTLKKLEASLVKSNYVGYIDINCLVNKQGIYPLEFTSRFGYPTIAIQQEGLAMPLGQFFCDLVSHKDFAIKLKSKYQVGARIVMPPFPYNSKKEYSTYSKDVSIVVDQKNLAGIYIEDIVKIGNEWKMVGEQGYVMVVAGGGATMLDAKKQAYERIHKIHIPNMYYRNDIGDKWPEESKLLKKWGYI